MIIWPMLIQLMAISHQIKSIKITQLIDKSKTKETMDMKRRERACTAALEKVGEHSCSSQAQEL